MTWQWVPLTQLEWFTSIFLFFLNFLKRIERSCQPEVFCFLYYPSKFLFPEPDSSPLVPDWMNGEAFDVKAETRGPACFSAPVFFFFWQLPLFLRACRSFRVYSTFQCQRLITAAWSSRRCSRSLWPFFFFFFDEKAHRSNLSFTW